MGEYIYQDRDRDRKDRIKVIRDRVLVLNYYKCSLRQHSQN